MCGQMGAIMMQDRMLYGEKIILRKMKSEDTEDIIRWRNQDFVRRNFIYQKPFTKEGHIQWISSMIETGKAIQFMIIDSSSDKPVGSVYFRDIDREHNKAEYGIFIGEEDALGRGFGTEAARLALNYAFEELRLHKVFLRVFAENTAAVKSYEKAGFKQEAYLRDEVCIDGEYKDMLLMAVISGVFICAKQQQAAFRRADGSKYD